MAKQIVVERWNPDDPATPVLIKPFMEDEHGPYHELNDQQKEAYKKTSEYCLVVMNGFNRAFAQPATMRELSEWTLHFRKGYLAAKTGMVEQ